MSPSRPPAERCDLDELDTTDALTTCDQVDRQG
jgi:hypothetical protein